MTAVATGPSFEGARAWLNIDRPLDFAELRGQLVILDFWTYCCVNCMHVLPVLRALEETFAAEPLVVIGVHSAKFETEASPEQIQRAIERYGIHHPVVVDTDMTLWRRFGVSSWPTLVIITPDGRIAGHAPGEPQLGSLQSFVRDTLAEARAAGTLAAAPLTLGAGPAAATGPLAYPGKAIAARDGRLIIADSQHHRVVVLGEDGAFRDQIGSGLQGLVEGPFEAVALDDPQGLFLDGDLLYIADARAHVICEADLAARTLRVVAGTGELGESPLGTPEPALEKALRSPWDVWKKDEFVLFASAGTHQLGVLDLVRGRVSVLAGSGREALVDGPAERAALAQPSALALDGGVLWFADSETSALRGLALAPMEVGTVVGAGLFDFGDQDGATSEARFQHCLGVTSLPDHSVVVADTYNHKLRRVDLENARVTTLYGGPDAPLPLDEPGGVHAVGDRLLVADTNHSRILWIGLDGSAREVVPTGVPPARRGVVPRERRAAAAAASAAAAAAAQLVAATLDLPADLAELAPGGHALTLRLLAPAGFKLAEGAPWRVAIEVSRRSDLCAFDPEQHTGTVSGGALAVTLALTAQAAPQPVRGEWLLTLDAVICSAGDAAACFPVARRVRLLPWLGAVTEGAHTHTLDLALPAPRT